MSATCAPYSTYTTSGGSAAASWSATTITGAQVGDLLVIVLASTDTVQSNVPTGWTRVKNQLASGASPTLEMFVKTATSGDIGATVTATAGSGTPSYETVSFAIAGSPSAVGTPASQTNSGFIETPPSATTSGATGNLIVCAATSGNLTNTYSAAGSGGAGSIQLVTNSNNTRFNISIWINNIASATLAASSAITNASTTHSNWAYTDMAVPFAGSGSFTGLVTTAVAGRLAMVI